MTLLTSTLLSTHVKREQNLTFLDAERVDGSVGRVLDAVFGTGGHDGLINWQAGGFRDVQLPAELSDERQTHGSYLHACAHSQ